MTTHVEVSGGQISAQHLSGGRAAATDERPPVIAVHGITANARCWQPLADRLAASARVIAPDLRGRAASAQAGRPYGLHQHAADVWAVADALAADEQVTLIGHSMGGFVAAMAAALRPGRVRRLVLVDGGLPFGVPAVVHRLPDRLLLRLSLGPALKRLDRDFASPQAYLDFWRKHPAVGPLLAGPDADAVSAYLEHDLIESAVGDEPSWRSSCARAAVAEDGGNLLAGVGADAARRVAESRVPVSFVWAGRGLQDQRRGLYRKRRLDRLDLRGIAMRPLPTANHYSLLFGQHADVLAHEVQSRPQPESRALTDPQA